MYEFQVYNEKTNETNVIFGFNEKDAWRRTDLDKNEWVILSVEYID